MAFLAELFTIREVPIKWSMPMIPNVCDGMSAWCSPCKGY